MILKSTKTKRSHSAVCPTLINLTARSTPEYPVLLTTKRVYNKLRLLIYKSGVEACRRRFVDKPDGISVKEGYTETSGLRRRELSHITNGFV